MNPRVLLIGLDAATFEYIDPWIDEGELPNIAQLIRRGVKAGLRSTAIPSTSVAWPSLVTGKNPGKTGLFDITMRQPGSYATVPSNTVGFQGPALWQILSEAGLRVGVVNVPVTYPPQPVNGYLISGFDTPRTTTDYAHPPGFLDQLAEDGHPYTLLQRQASLISNQNPRWRSLELASFSQGWVEIIRDQTDLLLFFLKSYPVHFLMTVFNATDSINHRTNDQRYILSIYRAADEALGRLLSAIGPGTTVILASDHGSCPLHAYLSMYRFLSEGGFLAFRREVSAENMRRVLQRLSPSLGHRAKKWWQGLPSSIRGALSLPLLQVEPRLAGAYDGIDWGRTRVYAHGGRGSLYSLYVNLKGREPMGIVSPGSEYQRLLDEVLDWIAQARDPASGQRLFGQCWRGQEIYHGPWTHRAPDIVVSLQDYRYHVITGSASDPLVRPIPPQSEYGGHSPEGILVMHGHGIKSGCVLESAEIADVMPTALYLFGLPLPEDVDGKVLADAFDPSYLDNHPVKYVEAADQPASPEPSREFTDEELADVWERLRGLGYVD